MESNKLLRITQINAAYLDKEIIKCALNIIHDAASLLPPGFIAPYEPEINLLVKLAVVYYSVVKNGSTFGQNLLSIKYENISTVKKLLYLIGHSLDYVKYKLELWNPGHSINELTTKVEIVLGMYSLLNLTLFLRNGAQPRLIERILGLEQVYAKENAQRIFDSKYMARELLWNGFIEMLVFVIPLINFHKLKRKMRGMNPFHSKPTFSNLSQTRVVNLYTKCAECGDTPVQPHHMGCPHVFCYFCLKANQIADAKYECPVCEYSSNSLLCDRVSVVF